MHRLSLHTCFIALVGVACSSTTVTSGDSHTGGQASSNTGAPGTTGGGSHAGSTGQFEGTSHAGAVLVGIAGQGGILGPLGGAGQTSGLYPTGGGANQAGTSPQSGGAQFGGAPSGGAGPSTTVASGGSVGGSGGSVGSSGTPSQSGGFGTGGAVVAGGSPSNAGSSGQSLCSATDIAANAVFVSKANGNDSSASGTKLLPFATINAGLAAAKALGVTLVAVEEGTYQESVTFGAAHNGIFVEGGFKSTGASWTRDCDPNVAQRTVIASPSNVGVTASSVTVTAGLRNLTVTTKAKGASPNDNPGESIYGVLVTGAAAAFRLEGVVVQVGNGGDGGVITSTPTQAGASACDRVAACSEAAPAIGSDGARQAGTATSGTFDATGYIAANGPTGNSGVSGRNGMKGGDSSRTCSTGCSCNDSATGCQVGCGSCSGSQLVHNWGLCGCGGEGGPGGLGGRGGGASIALFVSGDGATVAVVNSQLQSGKGGNGAAGGPGGLGGTGQPGALASPYWCPTGCGTETGCPTAGCGSQHVDLASGSPGGNGAAGGDGSNGGGGSGGPSYGYVTFGTAQVLALGSTFTPGLGGNGFDDGQGAAAAGPSATTFAAH